MDNGKRLIHDCDQPFPNERHGLLECGCGFLVLCVNCGKSSWDSYAHVNLQKCIYAAGCLELPDETLYRVVRSENAD